MVKELIMSIENENGSIYKKYKVEFKGKEDIIYYCNDEICFEFYGLSEWSDREMEDIKKELFDDAYYNINFSKYDSL
jgi:hypothetical protein